MYIVFSSFIRSYLISPSTALPLNRNVFRCRGPLWKGAYVIVGHTQSAAAMIIEIGTALAAAHVAAAALEDPFGAKIPAKSSTFDNHDRIVCLDAGLIVER